MNEMHIFANNLVDFGEFFQHAIRFADAFVGEVCRKIHSVVSLFVNHGVIRWLSAIKAVDTDCVFGLIFIINEAFESSFADGSVFVEQKCITICAINFGD